MRVISELTLYPGPFPSVDPSIAAGMVSTSSHICCGVAFGGVDIGIGRASVVVVRRIGSGDLGTGMLLGLLVIHVVGIPVRVMGGRRFGLAVTYP